MASKYMRLKLRDGNRKDQTPENKAQAEEILSGLFPSYAAAARAYGLSRERPRQIVHRFCQEHFVWSEWLDDKNNPLNLKELQKMYGREYAFRKMEILSAERSHGNTSL